MPPAHPQFERGFVVRGPSCHYGWFSQPTQPQVFITTTIAHGSLAPNGLCCPVPPRYFDPIRQSRRLPPLSQDRWLYRGSLPVYLLWAASETFPALGQYSFRTCRHPYAERRSEAPQSLLASLGLPPQSTESAPLLFPNTSFRRGFVHDAAVFALCYGPQGCLPSWTGPTSRETPAAEDVYTRACPRLVTHTPSRV